MIIYLIRHGQSEGNVESDKKYIIHGQKDKSPLTKKGVNQIKKITQLTLNQKIKIDLVITSPQKRALQSAMIIKNNLKNNILLNIDDRLKDQDFGDFEGKSWDEIKEKYQSFFTFYLKTKNEGQEKIKFILQKNGKNILESKDWYFNILALPSLKIKTGLFPKLNDSGFDFELQIFDEKENLVFQKNNLLVKVGKGEVANIENIVFGKKYRLVLLKPYYLPRQSYLVFKKGTNKISFKPMLPLDFDLDGKFSLKDILELIKKPKLLKLLFP